MHSEHFSESELACHHCGVNGVVRELLDAMELLRTKVGAPVTVDDAYRCPIHNAAVGGAAGSQHILGRAADVRVAGKTARELYRLALQIPAIKGLGVDDHKQYLHLDVRQSGHLAHWCYSLSGHEIPFFEEA
jgi:zinc D-Ala-D-Ala carboxypeptidase